MRVERLSRDRRLDGHRSESRSRGPPQQFPADFSVTEWRNSKGQRFFTGTVRDLTERKRIEQAMASSRRPEAVGQLAGEIAHDFNNLLAVISGNLVQAEQQIENGAARQLIERALEAVQQRGS